MNETGDDCVSIGDHTTNIDISRVKCGPGHGIRLGFFFFSLLFYSTTRKDMKKHLLFCSPMQIKAFYY